ncbi:MULTISPECIES: ABC transporter permease [Phyllobacteriaceae]|jgi:peptide/nickel transport system permease protein|uniref:Peptide ABC transporter permease n=1 Tax=Mesorhizobium hungaricum TaxID=1566387 RepID=A0A1C2EDT3_9HYPH|nr:MULTISPECIES: ABC transporter permease [Mesorhizobium]MBN9237821.1 ABC transporter permease [Mesorhizobium sp.]MDQ0329487.1 peptide/nickel transport system permease protein [Mesorhizobium sp. YL-MeA3-2017]OCX25178.1 peptide ABC transporter permease [Mesorhizobium hungaricum]
MTTSTAEAAMTTAATQPKSRGVTARIVRRAWGYNEMKIAASIFLALTLLTLFGPYLIDASATKMDVASKFLPPLFMEGGKLPHFLGTDQLGRDLLLRSLIGLRNAFAIGVVSVIGMFILGCAIGIYAGYRGGWADVILMRLTDVQMSIPVVILAITILGMSRPSPMTIIAVLILASWPVYARVSRGVTLAERQKEYVRAAKILGASDFRIMVRHIAPSILPPIAFVAVLDVARMMIFEAIFGFIGIGIQPPTPTFGTIISSGTQYLLNAWWITIVPGVLLALSLGSLNLMGGVLERARNHILQGGE